MRASADHRVRSKLVRLCCGDAARVAQVNAVPAKRCGCVVRLDAGRFPASFFPLPCCSCGEMRLPRRMSAKVGAVCSGCEPNVSRETFGVAGCGWIPMQGNRVLCMRQSMRPAARGTEGATLSNRRRNERRGCGTVRDDRCTAMRAGCRPVRRQKKKDPREGDPRALFLEATARRGELSPLRKAKREGVAGGRESATFAVFAGWRGDLLSASLLPISFRRKLE